MPGALAGQGHAHGPGGGGEAQAIVEAVADGGQAARGSLVQVGAARQRVPARAAARGGVCHCKMGNGENQRRQPAQPLRATAPLLWSFMKG